MALPSTLPTGALVPSDTAVTVYLSILRPCPSAAGQLTTTVPSGLATADAAPGGSGTSDVGLTALLVRAGPSPLALTACTSNVYVSPLVRPVTSTERWPAPTVNVRPAPTTTYRLIAAPFADAACQVTRASVLPAAARTLRGGPGLLTTCLCGFGGGGVGGATGGAPPRGVAGGLFSPPPPCAAAPPPPPAPTGAL